MEIAKIKIIKHQIRSAQNVGKAWISWKQILPAPFGATPCHFFHEPTKYKFSKIRSVLPKMLARSGLVGKSPRGAHLGPSHAIFSMDRKKQKMCMCCLFSLVGQWALFARFGVMCWCHIFLERLKGLLFCFCSQHL